MSAGRCECGDSECSSCGTTQNTRREVAVYAHKPGIWDEVLIAKLIGAGNHVIRLPVRVVLGAVGATEDTLP